MAAPTQAFPPWLTPQPFTVTQNGVATVETSVVQLPQTYYGPSIPLGPNWVFGGSTFPASIATSFPAPSVATPTPSSSVVPTESAPTTTPSQSLSTSSASPSASSSNTSTPSSSASTSSTSGAPAASHGTSGLSSGTRLAIILSTILGVLMLAMLLIVIIAIRRRAHRRSGLAGGGSISWSFISRTSPQQHAAPGGEEAAHGDEESAAFLARDQGTDEQMQGPSFLPAWPRPPQPSAAVPEPTALAAEPRPKSGGTKSDSSTLDSEAKREDIARFNASSSTADVGSLFFNPARGAGEGSGARRSNEADEPSLVAGVAAAFGSQHRNYATRPPGAAAPRVPARSAARPAVSPTALYFHPTSPRATLDDENEYESDVQRLNALRARESLDENAEDQEDELLPPRRLDPDHTRDSHPSSSGSRGSWSYPESPPSETDERATLLTARRVNVGQAAHPVITSSLSSPTKKSSLEGWVTPPDEEEARSPTSPGSWAVTMGGLAGFARGLGRLSWFRRMDSEAGPSGTRHSSPSRSRGSRPPSMVGLARHGSASRPQSGLLGPPFAPRPQSGVSFRSIDAELGLRPPGMRASATGSGSGSGSGKSGATVYHSVSSRPRSPYYSRSVERMSHQAQMAFPEPTVVTLPPDLDLGEGGSTVRSVDALDLPVPERSLPFGPSALPDTPSRGTKQDTVSSKGTTSGAALSFPPGLVSVPKWDRDSHSGSSRNEPRDVLEDEPPQAGGEWNSLRSKASAGDLQEEGSGSRTSGRPITRSSTGEQAVRVIASEPAASETASIATGPRQPSDQSGPAAAYSPRSLTGFGLTLTPRVSLYASSHSDAASRSHSGDGSYSSQPSHYTSHSQGVSQPSTHQEESEDGHLPVPGHGFNRASLSAIGGEQGQGPPQIPPLRPLSHMQPMLSRTSEDRETEGSDTSRPGTGTSRPMSELTRTGTFASGTGSTGAQTVVASTTDTAPKRFPSSHPDFNKRTSPS